MARDCCRSTFSIILFISLAVVFCFCGFTERAGCPVIKIELSKGISVHILQSAAPPVIFGPRLKLSDVFPSVSKASVQVIPGGHSIGIVMHSNGIMVVGMSDIPDQNGKLVNPAEEAGIRVGDLIISINGKKINSELQLRNEISTYGQQEKGVLLELKRDKKVFSATVKPIICGETGRPRVGLFVRDSASGVGTLSFYHPESGTYGALGHIISDIDTARGIDLCDGKVLEASIRGIHRGRNGNPGEKVGMFMEDGGVAGDIRKNTNCGIYGRLNRQPENSFYNRPVNVAQTYQIKKGPAEILTVIDGTEIKKYSVEVREVYYPWRNQSKGMVIKVTDPELIRSTGGIVQGMSGSPIMQDGMLIGVVTHVLVNDPLCGYGIPAEWMIKEAGLTDYVKEGQNAS